MLNALFGSEARAKILNNFILRPEIKYTAGQMARDLKLSISTVQKEIENILQLGLISVCPLPVEHLNPDEEWKGDKKPENKKNEHRKPGGKTDQKYYEINSNFILYPEIKALFIKAQILSSQKFINLLEKNFQPKLLILTGFFTNFPEAQTDIMIVGNIKRPAFLKLIADLEKDLGREINFTILDEKEFKYRREIMDIFLYNILEGKTLILIDNINAK